MSNQTNRETWQVFDWSENTVEHFYETQPDGSTFSFHVFILHSSFPEGDITCSTTPWLLPYHLELTGITDRLYPQRTFDELNAQGIECSLVMRTGYVNKVVSNELDVASALNIGRKNEFTLWFKDEHQRTAAALII